MTVFLEGLWEDWPVIESAFLNRTSHVGRLDDAGLCINSYRHHHRVRSFTRRLGGQSTRGCCQDIHVSCHEPIPAFFFHDGDIEASSRMYIVLSTALYLTNRIPFAF